MPSLSKSETEEEENVAYTGDARPDWEQQSEDNEHDNNWDEGNQVDIDELIDPVASTDSDYLPPIS